MASIRETTSTQQERPRNRYRRTLTPQTEPTAELNAGFSEPGTAARPWAEVAEALSNSEMFWLCTVRGDGRPHVARRPAIWLDGALHFCTDSQATDGGFCDPVAGDGLVFVFGVEPAKVLAFGRAPTARPVPL